MLIKHIARTGFSLDSIGKNIIIFLSIRVEITSLFQNSITLLELIVKFLIQRTFCHIERFKAIHEDFKIFDSLLDFRLLHIMKVYIFNSKSLFIEVLFLLNDSFFLINDIVIINSLSNKFFGNSSFNYFLM